LNLSFSNPKDDSPRLNYEVLSYDSRVELLTQKVQAPGMLGTLRAFIRTPPQNQEEYLKLSKLVRENEFSGQKAIILGGSRGLGEVTAKLLAAGGAHVLISYCQGLKEARNIVEQITQGGGKAKCQAVDVLDPNLNLIEKLGSGWAPTHLYYFATPMIVLGSKNSFSLPLFQKYCDYYISGFLNTFKTILSWGNELQGVFYPSTVAVSDLPTNMAEYTTAKSAGETLCSLLSKEHIGINFYSPRIPQTLTDQMAFFLPTLKQDPAPLMLESLRQFRDKEKT
jgi:NADP-dependent 3-hydroxy acid dehydrogenase YdfG